MSGQGEAGRQGDHGYVACQADLSPTAIWGLLREGCNTAEIAAYAQVSKTVARAMCAEAMREAHRQ